MTAPARPLLRPAWLRALVFVLAFVVLESGFAWIALLPPARVPPLLERGLLPAFAISAILLVLLFTLLIDRVPFGLSAFGGRGRAAQALAGLGLGIAVTAGPIAILALSGRISWDDFQWNGPLWAEGAAGLVLLAAAEEFVFRGYLLRNLLGSFKPWVAIPVSAVLYGLLHWTPSAGFDAIGVLTATGVGILLGMVYRESRSLWFPLLFHIAWNLVPASIAGFPWAFVPPGPLLILNAGKSPATERLDAMVTGGLNGLETSVPASLFCLLAIAAVAVLQARRTLTPRSAPVPDRK